MSNIRFIQGDGASIKWITFSDKTEACKIEYKHQHITMEPLKQIEVDIIDGTRDLIRIGLVKDALDRMGVKKVSLTLKYMPQARADRVFEEGNALPIKVFADILNSYKFNKVFLYDPHSDVTPALIDNCVVIPQEQLVANAHATIKKNFSKDFTLVAPDLGATKKIFDVVQKLDHDTWIQGVKIRDTSTGNIVECSLTTDHIEGEALIVDDICDNGMSFYYLADKLREKGAKRVGLYVTHLIMPNGKKGLDKLSEKIDYIHTSNFVGGYINHEDLRVFNER